MKTLGMLRKFDKTDFFQYIHLHKPFVVPILETYNHTSLKINRMNQPFLVFISLWYHVHGMDYLDI